MKITFFYPKLGPGGAERALINIMKYFDAKRFEITLYLIFENPEYDRLLPSNVSLHYVCKNRKVLGVNWGQVRWRCLLWLMALFGSRLLNRMIFTSPCDVQIAFTAGACAHIVSGAPKQCAKVLWVHTDYSRITGYLHTFRDAIQVSEAYAKYSKVICASNSACEQFVAKFPSMRDRSVVCYNVNDLDKILECAQDTGIPKLEVFTFITVGRLANRAKGFDRLIDAAARLRDERYIFVLWIVGDGEHYSALKEQIARYAVSDYIKLMGHQDNPYKYMQAADCFVCSSYFEGYSLVVAEAMIIGLPIITTDCTGPKELIEYGKYGILVENSTDGIYSGMKSMLDQPELRRKYALLAQERIPFFSAEACTRRIEEEIESVKHD